MCVYEPRARDDQASTTLDRPEVYNVPYTRVEDRSLPYILDQTRFLVKIIYVETAATVHILAAAVS